MNIDFSLNGEAISLDLEPETRLSEILREKLDQTGTKVACGIGRCGACTVLVDGRPVNACLLMAWQIGGSDVVTVEGLDAIPGAGIIRAALIEENAFQCGYCAPGFSIMLTALLTADPDADEAAIRAGLAGNICRCTGYHSIIRGALRAVENLRAAAAAGANT
jgi:carbon-monoxide dehydrogenase small subunit